MATIILNGEEEFTFTDYSRYINFEGETTTDTASISNMNGANASARLYALAQDPITSLQIKNNDNVIYTLDNLNGSITNIYEGYTGGDSVTANLNLKFNA